MIIIFYKPEPLGKIRIERSTREKLQIFVTKNGKLLTKDEDYSLREIEVESPTTIIQYVNGKENEIVTLVTS